MAASQNFDFARLCYKEIQINHDGSFSHDEGRQKDEDKNIQHWIWAGALRHIF